MSIDHLANQDYERAIWKSLWRMMITWLTGDTNELLPFDEVKGRLPARGQHYIGLRQVQIDRIVGSMGRYRDFDRAFLPKQQRTRDRWVSIDKAHLTEVPLPPVELYQMGEIYFVKDGNHRVSVARERGQEFIDASITEIDISVPLTVDVQMGDLELKGEYAQFLERTNLNKLHPEATIELTLPGEYERLLEHINVHRWYLGEQRRSEVPYEEAVASWYDNVFQPLETVIEEQGLPGQFPGRTSGDLYLWIIEYQWYRREAYKEEDDFEQVARQYITDYQEWPLAKLVNMLKKAAWVDHLILDQEEKDFLERTRINALRPSSQIHLTIPGMYERLLEHISVHRWYLGEQRQNAVEEDEAVISWYDNVYLPMVRIVREQQILEEFPGRTESDLYVWIIENLEDLRQAFGSDLPFEKAATIFVEDHSSTPGRKSNRPRKKKSD